MTRFTFSKRNSSHPRRSIRRAKKSGTGKRQQSRRTLPCRLSTRHRRSLRRKYRIKGGSDFYGTLGISPGATKDEIKKAYRQLALKLHPDRGGDTEQFKKLQNAYEALIKKQEGENATPKPPGEQMMTQEEQMMTQRCKTACSKLLITFTKEEAVNVVRIIDTVSKHMFEEISRLAKCSQLDKMKDFLDSIKNMLHCYIALEEFQLENYSEARRHINLCYNHRGGWSELTEKEHQYVRIVDIICILRLVAQKMMEKKITEVENLIKELIRFSASKHTHLTHLKIQYEEIIRLQEFVKKVSKSMDKFSASMKDWINTRLDLEMPSITDRLETLEVESDFNEAKQNDEPLLRIQKLEEHVLGKQQKQGSDLEQRLVKLEQICKIDIPFLKVYALFNQYPTFANLMDAPPKTIANIKEQVEEFAESGRLFERRFNEDKQIYCAIHDFQSCPQYAPIKTQLDNFSSEIPSIVDLIIAACRECIQKFNSS